MIDALEVKELLNDYDDDDLRGLPIRLFSDERIESRQIERVLHVSVSDREMLIEL